MRTIRGEIREGGSDNPCVREGSAQCWTGLDARSHSQGRSSLLCLSKPGEKRQKIKLFFLTSIGAGKKQGWGIDSNDLI